MDFQALIDSMNEAQARDRGNYHLTYGGLIEALKAAPADATFDKRVKGIGSWRGSYTEIALFTKYSGYSVEDEEYNGNYDDYDEWSKIHEHSASELPTNARALAELLESLIGKDFVGYKGGNFTIAEWKPLWLEAETGDCTSTAIIGIDKDLNLITKVIDD